MDVRDVRRLYSATRSGLRGLAQTPGVFALSVSTMSAGLLVLGAYLLVVQNMRGVADRLAEGLRVVAFLEAGHAPDADEIQALARQLGAVPGVAAVRYQAPDAALARLREELGADAGILDGLARNPLPASFEIEVEEGARDPAALRALAGALARPEAVVDVRYGEAWAEGYARLVRTAEWLGLALGVFLALVLAAIAAGTIRLALHSRADEIQIQRLVGASGSFIRLPFYLEGALQGALAAGLALLALWGLWGLGLPLLAEPLAWLVGTRPIAFFGGGAVLGLIALGTGLGVGGAALSLLRLEEQG